MNEGEDEASRQEEFVQTGLLLAAFERMTAQLAEVMRAHADLQYRLENLLQLQGWPKGTRVGDGLQARPTHIPANSKPKVVGLHDECILS